ncbi:MAG TPA: hypothetical protein VGD60_16785 [Candidatus Acidoferrales bacterium]
MREKNYNTGLRGVLFEARHYARMGSAIWLYGWLILRQTHQTGSVGWVLGGAPIHYREIEEETGFNPRTLERWMKSLREQKYIETAVVDGGITVKILKAKKHLRPTSSVASAASVRKVAGGVRGNAGRVPQKWVADRSEEQSDQQVAERIGSSFVVRIKEKEAKQFQPPVEIASQVHENLEPSWLSQKQNHHRHQKQNESPSQNQPYHPSPTHDQSPQEVQRRATQQQFSWELRERMRLIRAERDEEVRRELAVGTGPEAGRR